MELDIQKYNFFYDSVKTGIKLYKYDINEIVYTFFNNIQITTHTRTFCIEDGVEQTIIDIKCNNSNFIYKELFYDKIVSSDLISEEFRDAKTFKPNETNSYETSYFHFMVSEKGFAVYKKPNTNAKHKNMDNNEKSDNSTIKTEYKENDTADQVFYRILMMYLLALTYNQKMDTLSNEMAKKYKSKQNSNVLEILWKKFMLLICNSFLKTQ